jgi:hypothetical protein
LPPRELVERLSADDQESPAAMRASAIDIASSISRWRKWQSHALCPKVPRRIRHSFLDVYVEGCLEFRERIDASQGVIRIDARLYFK